MSAPAPDLVGRPLPHLLLPATDGSTVRLTDLAASRAVLYLYPRTSEPGVPPPPGWDDLPGARGCTPESCGFRDHHGDLLAAGVTVAGLSSQSSTYQREAAARLGLPFNLLSDPRLRLAAALSLPTFDFAGERLYARLTLLARDGSVEHVFHPVDQPASHAAEVLAWVMSRP